MVDEINIGKHTIGKDHSTFIIAEVGINHNGDVETAKKLALAAKNAGADAVKFQTYITEQRVKTDSPIFDILKKCELSPEQTKEVFDYCKEIGILFFSTVGDKESVDLLMDLGVECFKIASYNLTNKSLLEYLALQGKPIIISRGMCDVEEINQAIKIFDQNNSDYALLHCITCYPTKENDANLAIINTLDNEYNCPVGYSDHTEKIFVPSLSVAFGACIVEKHFMTKGLDCPDAIVSADEDEFADMVKEIRKIETIRGNSKIIIQDCEKGNVSFKRIS